MFIFYIRIRNVIEILFVKQCESLNELGAGHPKGAKLSVALNVVMSTVFGVIFAAATLATKYVS